MIMTRLLCSILLMGLSASQLQRSPTFQINTVITNAPRIQPPKLPGMADAPDRFSTLTNAPTAPTSDAPTSAPTSIVRPTQPARPTNSNRRPSFALGREPTARPRNTGREPTTRPRDARDAGLPSRETPTLRPRETPTLRPRETPTLRPRETLTLRPRVAEEPLPTEDSTVSPPLPTEDSTASPPASTATTIIDTPEVVDCSASRVDTVPLPGLSSGMYDITILNPYAVENPVIKTVKDINEASVLVEWSLEEGVTKQFKAVVHSPSATEYVVAVGDSESLKGIENATLLPGGDGKREAMPEPEVVPILPNTTPGSGASQLRKNGWSSAVLTLLLGAVGGMLAPNHMRGGMLALLLLLGHAVSVQCPTARVTVLVPAGCGTIIDPTSNPSRYSFSLMCAEACGPLETLVVAAGANPLLASVTQQSVGVESSECAQMCLSKAVLSGAAALGLRPRTTCAKEGFAHPIAIKSVAFPGLGELQVSIFSDTDPNPTRSPTATATVTTTATTATTEASEAEEAATETPTTTKTTTTSPTAPPTEPARVAQTFAPTTTRRAILTRTPTTDSPTALPTATPTLAPSNSPTACTPWTCEGDCFLAKETTAGGDVCRPVDHSAWDEVLAAFVVPGQSTGGDDSVNFAAFDYEGLKSDPAKFEEYLQVLANAPLNAQGKDDMLALWTNAYNALAVNWVRNAEEGKYSIVQSATFIPRFKSVWTRVAGVVGGKSVSLDDIEKKIIFETLGADGRFHAAINCASVSCPDLRAEAFVGSKLEAQLDDQAYLWVNDQTKGVTKQAANIYHVSKLFETYKDDFEGGVVAFINRYLKPTKIQLPNGVNLSYMDYNTDYNALE